MKKIVEVSPLIVTFLIFNGFLKLYLYYGYWHVPIINFLDFSEILMSFFADLNFILFAFSLMAIQATIGFGFLGFLDRRARKADSENKEDDRRREEMELAAKQTMNSKEEKKEEKKLPKNEITYDGVVRKIMPWSLVGSLILSILLYSYFLNDGSKIYLYFSCYFLLNTIVGILGNFKIDEGLVLFISVGFIFIVFTCSLAICAIKETRLNAYKQTITIRSQKETIVTSPEYFYLGKTQNYVFLYGRKEHSTTIISSSQIESITLREIQ